MHSPEKKIEDSIFQRKSESGVFGSATQNSQLQRTFGSPSHGFVTFEEFKDGHSEMTNSGPGSPLFMKKDLSIGKAGEFENIGQNRYFREDKAKEFFSTFILEEHELGSGKLQDKRGR